MFSILIPTFDTIKAANLYTDRQPAHPSENDLRLVEKTISDRAHSLQLIRAELLVDYLPHDLIRHDGQGAVLSSMLKNPRPDVDGKEEKKK